MQVWLCVYTKTVQTRKSSFWKNSSVWILLMAPALKLKPIFSLSIFFFVGERMLTPHYERPWVAVLLQTIAICTHARRLIVDCEREKMKQTSSLFFLITFSLFSFGSANWDTEAGNLNDINVSKLLLAWLPISLHMYLWKLCVLKQLEADVQVIYPHNHFNSTLSVHTHCPTYNATTGRAEVLHSFWVASSVFVWTGIFEHGFVYWWFFFALSPCIWPLGFKPHRVKVSQGIYSHMPSVITQNQRLHDWQHESQQAGERLDTLGAASRWGEGKSHKKLPLVSLASSFDAWVSHRLSHHDMPYWLQRIRNMERKKHSKADY